MSSKAINSLFFAYSYEFLNIYIPSQGMSNDTRNGYRNSLRAFRNFLNDRSISVGTFYFNNCTRELIISFMEWLKDVKTLNNNSISTRLAAIKSYVKYCAEKDPALTSVSLMVESVKPFKTEEKVRPVLTVKQVEQLLEVTSKDLKGYRNKTIILLLYESACRVSELTNLKVSNIFLEEEEPYIVVDGKGKKQRAIPISTDMSTCLKNYMGLFHNENSPNTDLLFYTVIKEEVRPLSSRRIQLILNEHAGLVRAKDKTFPENIYPHMFRRSRATQLYREGLPLEIVSAVLGHNQLETTRVYAIPSTTMMREAIKTGLMEGQDEAPDWKSKEDLLAKHFGL